MIDLVALRSLESVHRHGSVVAAADAMGFTPSAVSQQIKRLERQTGVPLLERVGRGVVLSGPGRHLVEAGSDIRNRIERLETDLRSSGGAPSGELSVVAFSTAVRGLVAPALGRLSAQYPALRVRLSEVEPWDAVDRVAGGEADLAVVHRWGDVPIAIPDQLHRRTVYRDVADVILPADHRLGRQPRITPHDLLGERWVATTEGTICRQWLLRMYSGTGAAPLIEHTSSEFESHLALVAATHVIALVPRMGRAALPDGTVAVPVGDPVPEREVIAVWRRSQGGSPAIQAVVTALEWAAALPSRC